MFISDLQEKWVFILLGNLGGLNFGKLIFKDISLKGKGSEGKTEKSTRNTRPHPHRRFRVPGDIVSIKVEEHGQDNSREGL